MDNNEWTGEQQLVRLVRNTFLDELTKRAEDETITIPDAPKAATINEWIAILGRELRGAIQSPVLSLLDEEAKRTVRRVKLVRPEADDELLRKLVNTLAGVAYGQIPWRKVSAEFPDEPYTGS